MRLAAGVRAVMTGAGSPSLHDTSGPDSPAKRALRAATQQAQRAQRAEAARLRQRAALLELMVRTMDELQISMAELNEARRSWRA